MADSSSDPCIPFNFSTRNSRFGKNNDDALDAAPVPPQPGTAVPFDPEEEFYDMRGEKRLVIFNHRYFECTKEFRYQQPEERIGTDEDYIRIAEVFSDLLGFNVVHHEDKTYDELREIWINMSKQDYSSVSCLIIVILTHGGPNSSLCAADRPYDLNDILKLFQGHPTLATKPKLFFVQACRGRFVDSGVKVAHDGPADSQGLVVPSHVDFLIMRSTVEDYVSYRDYRGSWLIQELCNFVEKYYLEYDILQIITLVNKKIAFNYKTFAKDVRNRDKKQTPETVFTLTKFLKF